MKINVQKKHNVLIPYDTEAVNKIDDFQEGVIYQIEINNLKSRSLKQNAALWKWCEMIAKDLNKQHISVNETLRVSVSWNKDTVKTLLFDPIMKALYAKNSSTKLKKDEFDKIIDNMVAIFAERGIIIPDFPSKD